MITKAEYAKSYKELYVLLHYVPQRYLEKLPVKVIKFFEKNMDKDYDYQVDPNLSYNDNKKSYLTSIILGNLFRDYWATDEQKEKTAVNDDFSNHEKKIIEAYRNNPDLQATIDRILGVQQEGQVLLWAAAQSEDNHAPKVIYMSKERWNKIQSAPDTDDPLL